MPEGTRAVSERVGVVGSAAIACGVATAASRIGPVLLCARSSASAQRARRLVDKAAAKTPGAHAGRVEIVQDLAELATATVVVEAIVEDFDAKVEVLADVLGHVEPAALIASTTSSLSIRGLGDALGIADRLVGFHVFNPVTLMPLVELAFAEQAGEDVRRRAHDLCAALEKTPIRVPDTPGFVVNRLLFPFLFDSVDAMQDTGLTAAEIDACMTLGAGLRIGPLAVLDLIGLDVSIAIGESIGRSVPRRIRELVADGALGKKEGRGFHEYRHNRSTTQEAG